MAMIREASGCHREIVQMMLNLGRERLTIEDYNYAIGNAAHGGYDDIVQMLRQAQQLVQQQ